MFKDLHRTQKDQAELLLVKSLCEKIGVIMKNSCRNITNKGVQDLTQGIETNVSLKKTNLDFSQ